MMYTIAQVDGGWAILSEYGLHSYAATIEDCAEVINFWLKHVRG